MTIDPRLPTIAARQPHPLLFATVSGAHLYGFPSPDSDYDLRGVHILPLRQVVGLDPGPETIEVSDVVDGLELDLVTHDAYKFFGLLLKRNGYVLEQLTSPLVVVTTPAHEELKALVPQLITLHHSHHYFGFAETKWRLIACKLAGPEHGALDDPDVAFYHAEYARLRAALEEAHRSSALPTTPAGRAALDDLLIRVRLSAGA